jgi:hypothetical protein
VLPHADARLRAALATRVFPAVARAYGVPEAQVGVRDLFFVEYRVPSAPAPPASTVCRLDIDDAGGPDGVVGTRGLDGTDRLVAAPEPGASTAARAHVDGLSSQRGRVGQGDPRPWQVDLALHRDGSLFSFNLLLNDPAMFDGGGTYFEAFDTIVHPRGAGDAVWFCVFIYFTLCYFFILLYFSICVGGATERMNTKDPSVLVLGVCVFLDNCVLVISKIYVRSFCE